MSLPQTLEAPQETVGPFILKQTLGTGATGKVKLGVHKSTGMKVAVKILNKCNIDDSPDMRRKVEREISVMKLIDHPCVMRLYDVYETSRFLFLVMEYVEGGELFDYLVKRGKLPMKDARKFFQQIIYALEHCHKHLICHRDLKPENLLLTYMNVSANSVFPHKTKEDEEKEKAKQNSSNQEGAAPASGSENVNNTNGNADNSSSSNALGLNLNFNSKDSNVSSKDSNSDLWPLTPTIKIADFGMASLMKKGSLCETSCGSPHYASPEVIQGDHYDGRHTDVWSCGVILYALLTGKLPFDDDNIRRLLSKVKTGVFSIPTTVCPKAQDLIRRMLTVDPKKRITIPEIKVHPFFVEADENFRTPIFKALSAISLEEVKVEPLQCSQEADPDILFSLQNLGWGNFESQVSQLLSPEMNLVKVFYHLMKKRGEADERVFGQRRGRTYSSPVAPNPATLSPQSMRRTSSITSPPPQGRHSPHGTRQRRVSEARQRRFQTPSPPASPAHTRPKAGVDNLPMAHLSIHDPRHAHPHAYHSRPTSPLAPIPGIHPSRPGQAPPNAPVSPNRRMSITNVAPLPIVAGSKVNRPPHLDPPYVAAHSPPVTNSPKRSWFSSFFKGRDRSNSSGSDQTPPVTPPIPEATAVSPTPSTSPPQAQAPGPNGSAVGEIVWVINRSMSQSMFEVEKLLAGVNANFKRDPNLIGRFDVAGEGSARFKVDFLPIDHSQEAHRVSVTYVKGERKVFNDFAEQLLGQIRLLGNNPAPHPAASPICNPYHAHLRAWD